MTNLNRDALDHLARRLYEPTPKKKDLVADALARFSLSRAEAEAHYHEALARRLYETPAACTRAVLSLVGRPLDRDARVLEPCAGDGAIVRVLAREFGYENVTAVEVEERRAEALLDSGAAHVEIGSFFEFAGSAEATYDLIVFNPPFELTAEFVTALLPLLSSRGVMCMYNRLQVVESASRAALFGRHMPDVYVLPNRVSRVASGATDMWTTCWLVWRAGAPRRLGSWGYLEHREFEGQPRLSLATPAQATAGGEEA